MYLSNHQLISQKELADAFEISTASVAVSLKKLEKGGYIEKEPDKADNRLNKVNVTQKGLSAIEASHQIFDSVNKAIFKDFTEEEINTMIGYWERLSKNMNECENTIRKEQK
jgi:Transcriptional regulators